MKIKSFAMLMSGLAAASFAFITPAMADDTNNTGNAGQSMQGTPSQSSPSDNSMQNNGSSQNDMNSTNNNNGSSSSNVGDFRLRI